MQKIKGLCERETEKHVTIVQTYPETSNANPEEAIDMEIGDESQDNPEEGSSHMAPFTRDELSFIKAEYLRQRLDTFVEMCRSEHNVTNLATMKVGGS